MPGSNLFAKGFVDRPPSRPPIIGATQNSHSWASGQLSAANSTVAVERAGLREVLSIGIDMMCSIVNVRPMATGAMLPAPLGSVARQMTKMKIAVSTISERSADISENPPGECRP